MTQNYLFEPNTSDYPTKILMQVIYPICLHFLFAPLFEDKKPVISNNNNNNYLYIFADIVRTFMKTEVINIFIVLSFFTSGYLLFMAGYAFYNRRTRGAIALMLILLISSIYALISGFYLSVNTIQVALLWLAYTISLFSAVIPVLWFIFSLHFTNRDSHLNIPSILLMFLIPAITTGMMISGPENPYFLYNIEFNYQNHLLVITDQIYGPFFWIHTAYSFAMIVIGSILIMIEAARLPAFYRKQSVGLVIATIFPVTLGIIRTFDLMPIYQIFSMEISLLFTSLIFSDILFRHRLFNIKPIARRLLIDSMSDAMLVFDANRVLIDMNSAANDIFNQTIDISIGKKADELFSNNENIIRELVEGYHSKHELSISYKGKNHYYEVKISPVIEKKRRIGSLLVFRDVSDRKLLEKNLHDLAMVDSLSGFYNYGYFLEFGRREIKRAKRKNSKLSAIMIDIDNFKLINDTYGHLSGNQVIQSFAQICRENIRNIDIAARYGGDEFIILLPDTKFHTAMQVAERIRKSVADTKIATLVGDITISISLGVVSPSAKDITDIEMMVEQSDQALYQSKRNGRNQVTLWKSDKEMKTKVNIYGEKN